MPYNWEDVTHDFFLRWTPKDGYMQEPNNFAADVSINTQSKSLYKQTAVTE